MAMGFDGVRNQERLCWRGQAVIYWTGLDSQLRVAVARSEKLVVREPRERETFAVGRRYQATASEDREDFICSVVTVIFGVRNSVRLP
jgi:hypothetical protein